MKWWVPKKNLPVTPFFDDRFLHNSWVGLAIDTNLFGNFDTIRFGHKSAKEKIRYIIEE